MEDLKQIQEFFSKPLNENKVTKEDFDKVVQILGKSKYPFTIMLVPKWDEIDIITGQDSPDEIVDDIGQRLDSAGLNWGGNSGITISGDSSNYSRREYSDIFRVNGGHKDYYEESVNEMDMNDPVMMKMRAAKDKLAKMRAANAGDDGNDEFFRNAKKIAFLKKERAQLMRDMEQEAEPEGGPIADEYGSKLNRIDAAIAKLSGRKEMDYDTAVGKVNEYDVYMPSQEEVDRFFELTNNETHYLYSKPVMGQEGTFNLMPIEPWDEYDYSNWKALVRKAKAKGKSIDEASRARVSKPRFKKDKNNPNFLNVYIDYDLGPGGAIIALGKETMTGQIRRESAAEAMRLAGDVARDLKAKYNLEDIDITDLENGKVQVFAVSDDFIDMDVSMLGENKMLKQAKLSSAEYQKAKKLKDFNKDDYEWNPGESLYIKLNESVAQTLAETIKLGAGVIEEELCPKGKAYIKRRKAAGEKSSAYLSGRAVKVCKGQMSGRKKRKSKKK